MCFDYDYIIRPTRKTLLDALKQVGKNDWEAVHFTEECHGHAVKYGAWVRRKIPDLPATPEPQYPFYFTDTHGEKWVILSKGMAPIPINGEPNP
jgi:hypothetical protein